MNGLVKCVDVRVQNRKAEGGALAAPLDSHVTSLMSSLPRVESRKVEPQEL
jgi:hypothetical protein